MTAAAQHTDKLLYRMKDLPQVVGISRTQIYRAIAAGKFPKGTHISANVVVWKPEDVRKWRDELVP